MIRHATQTDLPRILEIYDIARRFMRQNGNMVQWVNGYPSEPLLRQDIANGDLYVMEVPTGVCCTSAWSGQPGGYPTCGWTPTPTIR